MDLYYDLYNDSIPKINDYIDNKENKIKINKNNFVMIFTLIFDRLIIILDIYDSILNKWFYFVEIFDKSNENYELYEAYYNNELLLFNQKILQEKNIKKQNKLNNKLNFIIKKII